MTAYQINAAIRVLADDNLVWSSDFESIRKPLVKLLETYLWPGNQLGLGEVMAICEAIIEGENDGLVV